MLTDQELEEAEDRLAPMRIRLLMAAELVRSVSAQLETMGERCDSCGKKCRDANPVEAGVWNLIKGMPTQLKKAERRLRR